MAFSKQLSTLLKSTGNWLTNWSLLHSLHWNRNKNKRAHDTGSANTNNVNPVIDPGAHQDVLLKASPPILPLLGLGSTDYDYDYDC